MATLIADTACVDPRAEIADDVEIGPYCVIGPDVRIGRGTRMIAHACMLGNTTIGEYNIDLPVRRDRRRAAGRFLSGDADAGRDRRPQHLPRERHDQSCDREGRRASPASAATTSSWPAPTSLTTAGSETISRSPMARCSAATSTSSRTRALSGGVAVHHYVTIGAFSFVGGQSRITHDVPRFMLVDGNPSKVRCINIVGLKRNGIGAEGDRLPPRGPPADLPGQDECQARRRDPRVARPPHPRGPQPPGVHRDATSRQTRPGTREEQEGIMTSPTPAKTSASP